MRPYKNGFQEHKEVQIVTVLELNNDLEKELWVSEHGVYRVSCSDDKRFAFEHAKTGYREFFSEKAYRKLARDLKRGVYFDFNPSYGRISQFF